MMRVLRTQAAIRKVTSATTPSMQLVSRRTAWTCPFIGNSIAHFSQLILPSTYTAASALAFSPLGTLAYVALAYNVCVIGTKHLWYTMEFIGKDYLQDLVQQVLYRYHLILVLLLSCEALFIEA